MCEVWVNKFINLSERGGKESLMNTRALKNKYAITSVMLSLLIALAMMPGMAFAAANDEASVTINPLTSEVVVGAPYKMTATYSPTVNTHIDWSVTNGTGEATISKHKGQLVGSKAGTVTVTATLVEGVATEGGGSGTGTGGSQPCEGAVLKTATMLVDIKASSSYGFQGLSGNTMKLTNPASVLVGDPATSTVTVGNTHYTVYNNQISGEVALTNGTANFGYTMSAGMNRFSEDTFNYYKDDIKVLNSNHQVVSGAAVALGTPKFDSATKTINIQVSGLEEEEDYILQFGPKVCGNNTSKNLGCYVEFSFTTGN